MKYRASIFLLAYRMEKTILRAMSSALSQTIPCEIIVSDDASDDRGYELAVQQAEIYKGEHRVIVRRNPRNQGLCAHISTVAAMAGGEIFIFMAGDDVSYPDRVERLLRVFDEHADAYAVGSSVDEVDDTGRLLRSGAWFLDSPMDQRAFWLRGRFVTLLGASMAIRRELLICMPPPYGMVEDNMLTLRATLFGRVYCIKEPLLLYYRHPGNLGAWVYALREKRTDARGRRYERTIHMYREIADDHERCLSSMPNLAPQKRLIGHQIVSMYRIEADGREAILKLPKHKWLVPIWRGLMQPGIRRKSFERALKLLVPRKLLRL
jgi:glycosyltransferase involved in cell wall biosynthesis